LIQHAHPADLAVSELRKSPLLAKPSGTDLPGMRRGFTGRVSERLHEDNG
jgi:hypothetical protein